MTISIRGPKKLPTIPGVIRPALPAERGYRWQKAKLLLFLLSLLFIAGRAQAAAGGGGLPWEAPLTTLSNSVTGPVAYGASLIGLVGAGGVLIFAGGMINEFLRTILFIVLVIAFIISGKNTLTSLGFAAGATVSQVEHVKGGSYAATAYNASPCWD
jgi:type IV secretion system protein TrbC